MNFIEFETAQKLRGGFYTDRSIAGFLTRWVLEKKPSTILEPSCGDGIFIETTVALGHNSVRQIVACELDRTEAAKAARRGQSRWLQTDIHVGDFLQWYLLRRSDPKRFDAVIGNPPFIRYQYLPPEQQLLAGRVFSGLGLPFTRHTNAWVPFVLASIDMLAPGGRLAMVIPSEIFHIPHAQSLRTHLAKECARVLILDPEQLWFADTLQGVVLLLAEKKAYVGEDSKGVAVRAVRSRTVLEETPDLQLDDLDFVRDGLIGCKWMSLFLSPSERSLLSSISRDSRFASFEELARVDVGIVTGANKFFLVSDDTISASGLQDWAHPMFGRSEHVSGVIYRHSDHEENRQRGLPTNFLWFNDETAQHYPKSVKDYIKQGELEGLPSRFKCRTRTPWFRVPSVHKSPVGMLKRAHNCHRLFLNRAEAFSTDTAYRIWPKNGTSSCDLVYSFLNSATCLSAELEGRHYGGGVLELVPSEIERLILPRYKTSGEALKGLDERIRKTTDRAALLWEQDRTILRDRGLSGADCLTLHDAWNRLRTRRHRRLAAAGNGESASDKLPVAEAIL